MGPEPAVSTIVIAHDRADYLDQALNSVAGQTMDGVSHETILVKNFRDAQVDGLCNRLGIQNIYTDASSALAKVRTGIRASRGEILTFLDYDDVYCANRLKTVVEEFRARPTLGYYRNGIKFINAASRPISDWDLSFSFRLVSRLHHRRLVTDAAKARTDPRLGGCRPDFNTGSMAVRRGILNQSLAYLERIELTLDSFLFYSSWISSFDLLIDPRKLTQYRIHRWNSSIVEENSPETRAARTRYEQLRVRDQEIIGEMVARSGRIELDRDLRLRESRERLVALLRRPEVRRSELGALLRSLGSPRMLASSPLVWLEANTYLVAGMLSPALSRALVRISR
jgi:glycosyltransferase involved in cell wall biosynthesis